MPLNQTFKNGNKYDIIMESNGVKPIAENDNYVVYGLKLTDSCLKAINEFISTKKTVFCYSTFFIFILVSG